MVGALRRAIGDDNLPNDPMAAVEAVPRLGGPTLFVVDDVDRAQEEDCAVARALFRSAAGRALAIGTARSGAGWEDVAELLVLEPLGTEAVATWTKGRVAAEHAERVRRLTDGHPGALAALNASARMA